ncbi:Eco57I restriction-modification methylase domain-containing protein [Alkalibaculum sporogenes]|uniref:Eco57I restriction-modification methylase domain-containing protein n=1 Tax=Alkalibaculum sporogenes TaxID=2655001 RepID=UPI00187B625C|nr:N-6 DNA methylase [Alkalibaculum sporogenes]
MKSIFKEVSDLHKKLNLITEETYGIICIIKIVLLKFLIDNEYIKCINKEIKEYFTINRIIKSWYGEEIDYYQEENSELCEYSWKVILDYIECGSSLKGLNSNIIGFVYEYLNTLTIKKKKGLFYTPKEIIDHMIDLLDIDKGKKFTVIDPASGCGFFLSEIYDSIIENQGDLSSKDRFYYHRKIIECQLYGIEKDRLASLIARLVLTLKHPIFIPVLNIINEDALINNINKLEDIRFDYVIGNPPYIGHKLLDRDYFIELKRRYKEIFYDKADISFCFFKLGLDLLKSDGQLIYITSRYFLESLSGKGLRKYINENSKINKIIDFNGNRVIKGAKVDLAILHLTNNTENNNSTRVYKLSEDINYKDYIELFHENSNYSSLIIKQNNMNDDGWIFIDELSTSILNKIRQNTKLTLDDIANSYQGIITGHDKAFVLECKDIHKFNKGLLQPWIKNTNVDKYSIRSNNKYLLYTDDIKDINEFTYEFEYLEPFIERLSNRRECKNGVRNWYMLQWGRNKLNFKKQKIIFPYKAANNRFALDNEGFFFSADIYSLILEDNTFYNYTYEFLVCLLNSKLYEFYFKSYAKKLGGKLYEYYPNTIMRLRIPNIDFNINVLFKEYYDKIMYWKLFGNIEKVDIIQGEVNKYIYDFFGLSEEERTKIDISIKNQQ